MKRVWEREREGMKERERVWKKEREYERKRVKERGIWRDL